MIKLSSHFRTHILLSAGIICVQGSVHAAGKVYIDKQRNFRAEIPNGWKFQNFPIGQIALQIERSKNDMYGSCTLTVTDSPILNEPQTWIDENVNAEPLSVSHVAALVRKFEAENNSNLYDYYPSFLKVGGVKTSALFYSTSIYSKKLQAPLFSKSFFTQYSRTLDHLAITCHGIGASKLLATNGFATFNAGFFQFLNSIKKNE
jgi:hypothetical protein